MTKTHGMSGSREYSSWQSMINRCTNPNYQHYQHYGEKGIAVCEEWRASFEAFYLHIGPRPVGYTLDRIDPSGNYEPGNVRWADSKEQSRNRRGVKLTQQDALYIRENKGKIKAKDLATQFGVSWSAIYRVWRGEIRED